MDDRQYAPATQRNRDPILAVLKRYVPATGSILEIASGTGEHAVYLADALRPVCWIPSDPNPVARTSINAWRLATGVNTVLPALDIDVQAESWSVEPSAPHYDDAAELPQHPIHMIVNINMIHISPWSACLGLMAGAQRILPALGFLYLYGPYKINRQHTAPSNEAFDASLKAQNPAWGIRDLEAVITAAENCQLKFIERIQMPANNQSLIFQKI